jgi:hypothetical protein
MVGGDTAGDDWRARGSVLTGACVLVAVMLSSLGLAACGGGGSDDPTVLDAGQVNIKLPEGFKVVHGKVVAPSSASGSATTATASSGAADASSATATTSAGTTIPLGNGDNPQTALFTSLSKFRACLDHDGVKFIGVPDQSNPNSPTNDPNYIKSLSTCAAQSNIVNALQAAQTAQDNLTPAQIKQQNKGYLVWRDCMIARGWKVPEPKPDSKGRLFAFSSFSSAQGQSPIQAPPGKDILSSSDLQQCAKKAQAKVR